ncbi:MAG: porin [Candidatus Competibacteraceae bacterium]
MKRSTLALAITVALGTSYVALADTTLYGSARVSVDWNKPDYNNQVADIFYDGDKDNQNLQVVDDTSRLGIEGSEDLGSGMSAIYQFEFGVDVPGGNNYFMGNRPRWVGLKGDFGALTLGTQYTPFYNLIGYLDNFESIKSFDYFLGGGAPDTYATILNMTTLSNRGNGSSRLGSSVVYTTPEWRGLSAQSLVQMNGTNGPNNVDNWQVNLTYKNGPWFAGLVYENTRDAVTNEVVGGVVTENQTKINQYGALIGWDNKTFSLTGSWQQYNPNDKVDSFILDGTFYPGEHKINDYTVQGQYRFTDSDVLRLTYSYMKFERVDTKVNYIEAGLEHNMSKRTSLWVEYLYTHNNLDNDKLVVYSGNPDDFHFGDPKAHVVSVGVRHDF